MSKFSILRIVVAAACLAAVGMLGKRESALAGLPQIVLPAQDDSGFSETSRCPCFDLEVLEAGQSSGPSTVVGIDSNATAFVEPEVLKDLVMAGNREGYAVFAASAVHRAPDTHTAYEYE